MDIDRYIGRLLDNRYEIQEVLGIGGMAIVYKARCHRLNRLVAIKILKDEYSKDDDFRRRFHAEGQAVAMLSHPNIVSVYDVSSANQADYIVMELIDGISLKQYMEKKGVLNWKETLHFAMQISKALEHAHSRGIVHRDIKPHNIMVLKNGSVKVADFGIARVMSAGNTLTKEALGSVHYISPEQAKGGRVDDRSDIYSLGTVMYEMMTGRPPYDGESPVAVAIQHINGGAKAPSSLNANIPGGMEQIIMRAMAHDPGDRYNSASAMLADMEDFRRNPTMLFDYNTPPTDVVTQIKPVPPKPKTTAQRVASGQHRPSPKPQQPKPRPKPRREAPQRVDRNFEAEEDRSKAGTIAIISCSVVAIVAIVIFLFVLFGDGNSPDSGLATVPTLLGKNYETLNISSDFIIKFPNYQHSDTYEKGQIIDQTPEPGTKVARGTEIHIWISLGPEPKVKVMENLVGQERTTAENYLDGQGVLYLCSTESSDTVPEGRVIRTDPEANTTLEDGQTVMLYISTGPEIKTGKMPKVAGQSLETARTILKNQNLELDVKELEEHSNSVEAGVVIRSEPVSGTELKSGDTVVLYISKGPEQTRMPEVVGETLETALKMLSAAGLNNVEYDTLVESELPEGSVAEQSVEVGQAVPITEKIVLSISSGPKPQEVTLEHAFVLLEDMEDAYSVKITRQDNGEAVFESTVSGTDSSVTVSLTGAGTVVYEVYINGIYFKEEAVEFTAP